MTASVDRQTFLDYMQRIEEWAEAYDREAMISSREVLDLLYTDAFFEAIELTE